MGVKQVIVMRKDLNMRKGKMIVQGAHAAMKVLLDAGTLSGNELTIPLDREGWFEWVITNFRKIAVSVNSEQELLDVLLAAQNAGLPASLIEDDGLTEFRGVKTKTAIAVGPAEETAIDAVTGHLPLL